MPSVMRLLGGLGGLDEVELRATFNGGLGMVVVVPPEAAQTALDWLAEGGAPAVAVGDVVPVALAGGRRYLEIGASA